MTERMLPEHGSRKVITAAVFDLGGVLIDWDPEHLYRELIPDPGERHEFLTTICTPAWNAEMDAGRSVQESVAALASAHPDRAAVIEEWWTRWPEMLNGEIPDTRPLVETLSRSGLPLYALTNWSAETWPLGVQRYPFVDELFDGIVVSGQERIAKPDPRLFEILNDRYELNPESTIYVDDSPANIETAGSIGYATHLFTTADRLHRWLNEIGLLETS
ncbi:MAG: HAD family phosphatase [Actinomycetota bacterium]|nr:HAD family phosphatase [Actinomycetota bacterium]